MDNYQVTLIPLAQIVPGDNDRTEYDYGYIRALAKDIKKRGLDKPITVRPIRGKKFEIVEGHCRYFAHEVAKIEKIPVFIRTLSDLEAADLMWRENNMRKPLDPIDEALAIQKRMKQFGLNLSQTADAMGVSISWASTRLDLLKLRPDIQQLVRTGNLRLRTALAMKDLDHNFQLRAIDVLNSRHMNHSQFVAVCSALLGEQNQGALFDIDAFMKSPVDPPSASGGVHWKTAEIDYKFWLTLALFTYGKR